MAVPGQQGRVQRRLAAILAAEMRRREFITILGSTAAAGPLAARAQKSVPRVGVLLYSSPHDPLVEPFRRGLADLGYTEGRNLAIDYRYAEGKPERLPGLAADLAGIKPDVIVALGGDVAPWAKKATETIPVVFAVSTDPVQSKLVVSLARPVENATGVTFLQDELASKRLELFKEAAPQQPQTPASNFRPKRQILWFHEESGRRDFICFGLTAAKYPRALRCCFPYPWRRRSSVARRGRVRAI